MDAYTVLWDQSRCREIKKHGQEGAKLEVLFGGPHSSLPGFRRFGVKAGDLIYPLHVLKGSVYILGRMKVKRLLPLETYIEEYPEVFAGCERAAWPYGTLLNWIGLHPEKHYLAPTCTEEVAIGEEGTGIRFDLLIPPDLLARMRYRSSRGERGIKYVIDGRLVKAISLQGGVYRLSEATAGEFENLFQENPPL